MSAPRPVHFPAVVAGALVTLAVAVPTALLAQILDDAGSVDDDSPWLLGAFAVILFSMAVGGFVAANRRPDAPLTNSAAASLLAYLFGWIGGLIVYLTQKNPEARFHGAQSVLLSIAVFAVYVVLFVLTFVSNLFGIFLLLLWLAAFGVFIFMCVQGYQMKHTKLPIIGDIAEQWASKPT